MSVPAFDAEGNVALMTRLGKLLEFPQTGATYHEDGSHTLDVIAISSDAPTWTA